MISFESFYRQTSTLPVSPYHPQFRQSLQAGFYQRPHGELQVMQDSLEALPQIEADVTDFTHDAVTIGTAGQLDTNQHAQLYSHLQLLHPWRKGPWRIFGIEIDAEWCSNLKWERIHNTIAPLHQRLVLDVGCGNGYYAFRMLAREPAFILGIEPSQKYVMQFQTLKRLVPDLPVEVLPLADTDIPAGMACFDTVFSMGVIYHRRDPALHLATLSDCLRKGGELVLESLVIEGDSNTSLVPEGRYANMRNVHAVPSVTCLRAWLEDAGFVNIRLCDLTKTTFAEQRSTQWMRFQSLVDFLNPEDQTMTIEGFPAPVRATYLCNKA